MTSYYRPELAGLPEMALVGRQLWEQAGLGPQDIDMAVLYDHFTPYVLMQLEELGFCGRGEAKDFIADGAIDIGGRLPLNTHGGQLGEAYIHGMNGIAEGVRQIRGTSVNQVKDAARARHRGDGCPDVRSGADGLTSGLLLRRAMCFATYSASLPTPPVSIEANARRNGRPTKYSPGWSGETPRACSGHPSAPVTGIRIHEVSLVKPVHQIMFRTSNSVPSSRTGLPSRTPVTFAGKCSTPASARSARLTRRSGPPPDRTCGRIFRPIGVRSVRM